MMNAISKLKEYHEKHKKEESPPVYFDGPSLPNGEFTVTCKFLKIDVDGHGRRKKDAKCEAANNMLSLIKLQEKDLIETSPKKSLQTDDKSISAKPLSNNVFTKPEVSHTVSTSDIIEFQKHASNGIGDISNYDEICDVHDVHVGFRNYDMVIENPSDSPIKKFLSIIKSQNLKYSYSILPSSNKQRVSLIIKLSHHHIVSGYSAETEGEAIQATCQRILEMIKAFSNK